MKKKFIISWIVLGVILVVSYYLLGGFTEVKLDLIQEPAFEIVGKMSRGAPRFCIGICGAQRSFQTPEKRTIM